MKYLNKILHDMDASESEFPGQDYEENELARAELQEVYLRSQLLDLIIEKREHYKDLTEVDGEHVMALDYTDYGFHVNEMINNYLSGKGDQDHAQI